MIQIIDIKQAESIIINRKPLGRFYVMDKEFHVGIDNTDGEAWTEDFTTKEACYKWLHGGDINA